MSKLQIQDKSIRNKEANILLKQLKINTNDA